MQWITVLGSTGSIGTHTLDVIARHPDRYRVFALTAAVQVERMVAQCQQFLPRFAVMSSHQHAQQLQRRVHELRLDVQVLAGAQALCEVCTDTQVDVVMAAIVGAAGLAPCLDAARWGKKLLLANKEALVVGGDFFMDAVRAGGATLIPIDSEHSAIFQSLPEDATTWGRRVQKIVLTASGGPFRLRDPATLHTVTPEQACSHPNWSMGRKISVDSASMMNKALEVIEAHYLFGLAPSQIEVVIHPQSIIHSMVQYHDTSVIAQMGSPDMRVPIAYGLAWPERIACGAIPLDFSSLGALNFEKPDKKRFACLQLAWDALNGPTGSSIVLNAANEIAVQAFLDGRLRFDQIYTVNQASLQTVKFTTPNSVDELLAIDAQARMQAKIMVEKIFH